ncbi:MAG: radical SAM/SPASM domain-containing protein [Bacteroidetes bacterium]|nr:radical SAM/SPASM domain-containing protein [Bacteroidota bacterium]
MGIRISPKKRIALGLYRKYKQNLQKLHPLKYIFWECTLKCNLNCLHCGSDCKQEADVADMPIKDFIKAIDDITPIVNPNETMIVFTGGEPLLRKDLEKCGQALYERGFPWGMVTNGLAMSEKRLNSLLNSGMRSVTVSLDGLEEDHNWMRGNSKSYQQAINAIELLAKQDDLVFDVVTCMNQKSIHQIHEIKELLINKGVKEWRIFTIFPIGRAKEHSELKLTPKQFKWLFDEMAAIRNEDRIKLNYGCEGFLGGYETEIRDNMFLCAAGIHVASVMIDGSISACPNLRSNFVQGNIYKDSFKEVWETKYVKHRDRSWARKGECLHCDKFKYCEGNGMHLRDENEDLIFCHYNTLKEAEKL